MPSETDYSVLKNVFKSDGNTLRSRKHGRSVNPKDFMEECFNYEIDIKKSTLLDQYNSCTKQLKESTTGSEDPLEQVVAALDKDKLFEDFKLLDDRSGNPFLQYTNLETGIKKIFCTVADVTPSLIYTKILGEAPELLDLYVDLLQPYTKILGLRRLVKENACEQIWFRLFSGTGELKRELLHKDQMPVILAGAKYPSNEVIEYTKKEVTLQNLHPSLENFLVRTENHEYLCAIIATRLLGFRRSFIPCLIGDGEDGKSTFTAFLDKLVRGYTAPLDLTDTYALYECIDKLFLFISDSSNSKVFYYELVKRISGNDVVRIQAKYQQAKNIRLPGMIFIVTNHVPVLSKKKWLNRRARLFKVAPLEITSKRELLTVDMMVEDWMSTSDEFINYCMQCLSKVGNTETGAVDDLPNQQHFLEEVGSAHDDELEDFLIDLKLNLDTSLKITEYKLRTKVREVIREQRKDAYFQEKFLEFLRNDKRVKRHAGYYCGIGLPETPGNTQINIPPRKDLDTLIKNKQEFIQNESKSSRKSKNYTKRNRNGRLLTLVRRKTIRNH